MIDIGAEAIDREQNHAGGWTLIAVDNPANASGTIDTVKIWSLTNLTGVMVGTFYLVSGTNYKCRDSVSIGNITGGSEQIITGLSINVVIGDHIGVYWYTGAELLEADENGNGLYRAGGDYINPGDEATYALASNRTPSLYGTGGEAPPPVGKRGWWSK